MARGDGATCCRCARGEDGIDPASGRLRAMDGGKQPHQGDGDHCHPLKNAQWAGLEMQNVLQVQRKGHRKGWHQEAGKGQATKGYWGHRGAVWNAIPGVYLRDRSLFSCDAFGILVAPPRQT